MTEAELRRLPDNAEFQDKWGMSRAETARVRIIEDGEGTPHLVEARWLEPEFHRLTEATRTVVTAADVAKKVINAPVARARLRNTHLGRYIAHAEARNWHRGSTVASRARTRGWYDLGLLPAGGRAQMFWPMAQQYRHVVPWNVDHLVCNHNLFDVWAGEAIDSRVLWAILNSSVVALTKHQFGRAAGIEGNLKTEVVDAKMMLVPNPSWAEADVRARLVAAADGLSQRAAARYLYEEFELEDRRNLDDAVLLLLGIEDDAERDSLRRRIYEALEALYRATRERELIAQQDRMQAARRGARRQTPAEIATEIWDDNQQRIDLHDFPRDFVESWAGSTAFDLHEGDVEVGEAMIATGRHLEAGTIRIGGPTGNVHNVGGIGRARFLAAMSECGAHGPVRLPPEDRAQEAANEFARYKTDLARTFRELASQRTRDERRQRQIVDTLIRMALRWRR